MPVVRPAHRTELRATARLHRSCLPGGFFARLGAGFLRAYHASFRASPLAVALVVAGEDGAAPAGFLVGTLRNRDHYAWVVRHRALLLALRGVLALLVRPRLAWMFLRTRARRYTRWVLARLPGRRRPPPPADGGAPDPPSQGPVAVLTHVAVAPDARGSGVGRALTETFVAEARAAGAFEARLVTDARDGAAAFYTSLGWTHIEDHHGAGGSLVSEFRLPLRQAATP